MSLRSESGLCMGPSVPFRRESSMSMTSYFNFTEAVLTQNIRQLNLDNISMLDEPLSSSLFHLQSLTPITQEHLGRYGIQRMNAPNALRSNLSPLPQIP